MRVLGIDPGIAACGYGVIDVGGHRVRPIDFGCLTTPSSQPLGERLTAIYDTVTELVGEHEPGFVAIEESYVGADPRNALTVGQARGAILVACTKAGVESAEYPPSTVKQAVCGSGRAGKEQVQQMVCATLRLDSPPKPHHAADALAVAICHALGSPLLLVAGARR